jgi:hypothetical protein
MTMGMDVDHRPWMFGCWPGDDRLQIINMAQDTKKSKKPLHVLLVTYEFTFSPFSGNGILARSLVKSLLEHGCRVTVWCCRPHRHESSSSSAAEMTSNNSNSDDHHLEPPEFLRSKLRNCKHSLYSYHPKMVGNAWMTNLPGKTLCGTIFQ